MDLWQRRWSKVHPCLPDQLKIAYRDQWIRFHCLPESKRYPETEREYGIVLDRYNTVLDRILDGPVYLMTTACTHTPQWVGSGAPWQTAILDDEPGFESYAHQFLSQTSWRPGVFDDLLRKVADSAEAGVIITDTKLRWLFHPYDGGMDIIAPNTADRDLLRDNHRDWQSGHPQGY